MKSKILLACMMLLAAAGTMSAQITGDVIGVHDLGPGSKSPITGARPDFCLYCHAPHTSLVQGTAPLWNQKLTTQTFTPYTSTTYHEKGNNMQVLGADSNLCLSCHDGTVAVGNTAAYGQVTMTGSMNPNDVFQENTATSLQASHPFSLILPLNDASNLVSTLVSGQTADKTGAVKLIQGNIECTSCHNPHVQAKDPLNQNFLALNSASGVLCYACHDPNRQASEGQDPNPLNGWYQSIHATSTAAVQNLPYPTLATNACFSCHTDHNAAGPAWLQRGSGDQVCLNCHSGTSSATANANTLAGRAARMMPNVVASPKVNALLNVASEYAKVGHPIATTSVLPVKPGAKAQTRAVVANNPTLTGCVNCHDPHAMQSGTNAASPAAPMVRATQRGVDGISEKDGMTVVRPAKYQFETCLRCHGPRPGKAPDVAKYGYIPARLDVASDPRNIIPQFSPTAASSHPVTHPRSSAFSQPSLLANMWNLNGTTQGRVMGSQIFCTDCHNSDDNREFGGTGPSGPHGSRWTHILERRYEFSQAPAPGQPITNLFPNPDLTVNGPYALCGKCHNLTNVMQNASFSKHAKHISAGMSCSTCHTAHGTGSGSANVSGQRLINFDMNVVAPNGGAPITYNRGANTCTLSCHGQAHNPDGTVGPVKAGTGLKKLAER